MRVTLQREDAICELPRDVRRHDRTRTPRTSRLCENAK